MNHSLEKVWFESDAFNAYRGDTWMHDVCEPVIVKIDFGGYRCRALSILGDASAADPVCSRAHPTRFGRP